MMKRIILNLMAAFSLALIPAAGLASTAYACPATGSSQSQVLHGVGTTGGNCNSSGVGHLASTIVEILSFVAGIAAVIMVITAGFKYITSGGESSKVANAKGTLVYALVGLAVAALAQFLVHFVINTADATQPCPGNTKILVSDPKCK